jgi:hypothetical protein
MSGRTTTVIRATIVIGAGAIILTSVLLFRNSQIKQLEIDRLNKDLLRIKEESSKTALQKRKSLENHDSVTTPIAATVPVTATIPNPFRDPKYAFLWQRQASRDVWRNYGAGILALNLTNDQRDRLKSLLVARNEAAFDALDAANLANLPDNERGLAIQQTVEAVNKEIDSLIGADGRKELEAASAIEGVLSNIDQNVGIDLASSGSPLSQDQRMQLAQVISATNNLRQDVADPSDGALSPQGLAVVSQSTAFLTSDQLQVLRNYEAEQLARWQYNTTAH